MIPTGAAAEVEEPSAEGEARIHWLHVDLPERVAALGYPLRTVTATG